MRSGCAAGRRSERQRLVHPVVVLEDLLAVEAGEVFRAVLGHLDQPVGADGTPELALARSVAEKKVIVRAGEHLRRAGVALTSGAAEELSVVTGLRTDRHEGLVTSIMDAIPEHRYEFKKETILPLLLAVFGGTGLVIYIVMWVIVPDVSKV